MHKNIKSTICLAQLFTEVAEDVSGCAAILAAVFMAVADLVVVEIFVTDGFPGWHIAGILKPSTLSAASLPKPRFANAVQMGQALAPLWYSSSAISMASLACKNVGLHGWNFIAPIIIFKNMILPALILSGLNQSRDIPFLLTKAQ